MSKHRNNAFSLVELLVALIVVSCIIAAFAPVMTKRLNREIGIIKSGSSKNHKLFLTSTMGCTNVYENDVITSKYCSFTVPKGVTKINAIVVSAGQGGGGAAQGTYETGQVSCGQTLTITGGMTDFKIDSLIGAGGGGGAGYGYKNGTPSSSACNEYSLSYSGGSCATNKDLNLYGSQIKSTLPATSGSCNNIFSSACCTGPAYVTACTKIASSSHTYGEKLTYSDGTTYENPYMCDYMNTTCVNNICVGKIGQAQSGGEPLCNGPARYNTCQNLNLSDISSGWSSYDLYNSGYYIPYSTYLNNYFSNSNLDMTNINNFITEFNQNFVSVTSCNAGIGSDRACRRKITYSDGTTNGEGDWICYYSDANCSNTCADACYGYGAGTMKPGSDLTSVLNKNMFPIRCRRSNIPISKGGGGGASGARIDNYEISQMPTSGKMQISCGAGGIAASAGSSAGTAGNGSQSQILIYNASGILINGFSAKGGEYGKNASATDNGKGGDKSVVPTDTYNNFYGCNSKCCNLGTGKKITSCNAGIGSDRACRRKITYSDGTTNGEGDWICYYSDANCSNTCADACYGYYSGAVASASQMTCSNDGASGTNGYSGGAGGAGAVPYGGYGNGGNGGSGDSTKTTAYYTAGNKGSNGYGIVSYKIALKGASGGGGSNGNMAHVKSISVTPGEVCSIMVGIGGKGGAIGSTGNSGGAGVVGGRSELRCGSGEYIYIPTNNYKQNGGKPQSETSEPVPGSMSGASYGGAYIKIGSALQNLRSGKNNNYNFNGYDIVYSAVFGDNLSYNTHISGKSLNETTGIAAGGNGGASPTQSDGEYTCGGYNTTSPCSNSNPAGESLADKFKKPGDMFDGNYIYGLAGAGGAGGGWKKEGNIAGKGGDGQDGYVYIYWDDPNP